MVSHRVTCHPAEAASPALTPVVVTAGIYSIYPAWQPRPSCIAVLRDRCVYMTCVVGRAVCLGYIKVNIIIF